MRPVEVVQENPSWAKFRDPHTGLFYYACKMNGEATYDRPAAIEAQQQHDQGAAGSNDGVASSVDHFEGVVNSTAKLAPGQVPASQKMGPPPPFSTKPLSPSTASPYSAPSTPTVDFYYKSIKEIDMPLFIACRDGRPAPFLDKLIGGNNVDEIELEDDAFAEVNRQWCAKRDGSGWDVLPEDNEGSSTSFFWPASLKPTTHTRNVYAAVPGDTILHIAIKLNRRDILEWLSQVRLLDLNVANSEGLTASAVADEIGKSNMYTFYFVFR